MIGWLEYSVFFDNLFCPALKKAYKTRKPEINFSFFYFPEKYDLVGRLLKPGEEPINYSDEEQEDTDTSTPSPTEDKKEQ